jgi:septin family protein
VQVTHDVHYENFRSQRLSKGGAHAGANKAAPLSDKDIKDKMLAEKDEELRRMQVCQQG